MPMWYSMQEVAEMLHVSLQTVRRWIQNDGLKTFRAGKIIRIDKTDLDNFLRNKTVDSES